MPTIKLKDGAALQYLDEGKGPAVLLLHGWGMRAEVFRAQLDGLSHKCRMIAPDLRGHGGSGNVGPDQNLATLGRDIEQLITDLHLTEVVLVGWSMGAMLGWGLLDRCQDRFRGMLSVDMVPRLLNDSQWQLGLRSGNSAAEFAQNLQDIRRDWTRYSEVVVARMFAKGDCDQSKRRDLASSVRQHNDDADAASMAILWESLVQQDYRATLTRLKLPMLLAFGRLSQLYSTASFEWLHQQFPNSRLAEFTHSGHAPLLEEPDQFNQILAAFILDPAGYVQLADPIRTT